MLLDTEHTPLLSRPLLSPRWMGLFKVLASTAPNSYRLELLEAWRVFDKFHVAADPPRGRPPGPGPWPTVQELLK